MYVRLDRTPIGGYQLYCGSCGIACDVVDGDYIRWATTHQVQTYCHDCDGGSDCVPDLLWPYNDERLIIGNVAIEQDERGVVQGKYHGSVSAACHACHIFFAEVKSEQKA